MNLSLWAAGRREYRLALIIAAASSLLLIVLLMVPETIFERTPVRSGTDSLAIEKKSKTFAPAFSLPARPTQKPAVKQTTTGPSTSRHQGPASRAKQKMLLPESGRRPGASAKAQAQLQAGYYVQAGAFKDPGRAKKLAALLRHSGWHVRTIIKEENLHAVLAGPWPTRTRAENARRRLRAEKRAAFIVHIQ